MNYNKGLKLTNQDYAGLYKTIQEYPGLNRI